MIFYIKKKNKLSVTYGKKFISAKNTDSERRTSSRAAKELENMLFG